MKISDFVLIIAREALRDLGEEVGSRLKLRRREEIRTELVYNVVEENNNTCCTITIRPALIRGYEGQGDRVSKKIEHWVEVEVNLARLDMENDNRSTGAEIGVTSKVISVLQKAHEIANKIDEYILKEIVLGRSLPGKLEKLKELLGGVNISLSLPVLFIQPLIQIQPGRQSKRSIPTQQASKEDIGVLSFKSWLFVKMLISFRRAYFY